MRNTSRIAGEPRHDATFLEGVRWDGDVFALNEIHEVGPAGIIWDVARPRAI
jgi:hypothetical protein